MTSALQTREALRRIAIALSEAGATLSDVVRTRIYVTDISRWREVAAVHAEIFGEIRPAATMVEVAALIAPELVGGDRSRRLLVQRSANRREGAVSRWQVAGDIDHSTNWQGAVQMREQHRLRIRCYSQVPNEWVSPDGPDRCAARPGHPDRGKDGWPAGALGPASTDGQTPRW